MAVVVDDHVLLDVLAGNPPSKVAPDLVRGTLYTTGSWYYRLGRALHAGGVPGSLSTRLTALDPSIQQRVLDDLRELPDDVALVSPRVTVPVMIGLRVRRPLNLLNAEALAVAVVADATLVVTADSPLLRSGAADLGVPYVLVG